MSNHIKYPGLYADAKAARINLSTVIRRITFGGMTREQALSTPVGMVRRGRNISVARKEAIKRERNLPDSAPKHIQLARAEYCMKFMRAEIDQKLLAKL